VRREAMQTCQREEAEKRLCYLGLNRIHLPAFTTTKPDGPHVVSDRNAQTAYETHTLTLYAYTLSPSWPPHLRSSRPANASLYLSTMPCKTWVFSPIDNSSAN
jgi:hypothetical protein